jgi:hypothetical protein
MPRSKPTKPTRKMKQAALAALHDVVKDSGAADYTKVRAATALLGADRSSESADDPLFPADPDAPRVVVHLPWNGRDHVKFGGDGSIVVENTAGHPLDMPDKIRARSHRPRPELPALPAPDEDEA